LNYIIIKITIHTNLNYNTYVEREHESVVLMRHWAGDGPERHHELIESERRLRNWGILNVTLRLQVGTPIILHGVKCRRMKKRVKMR
jgi:hypothetical protein